MFRIESVRRCESHELIQIVAEEAASSVDAMDLAILNFCQTCAGVIALQRGTAALPYRVWICIWDHSQSNAAGPYPFSWVRQTISVRLDGPGESRLVKSTYIGGGVTLWGKDTQLALNGGYRNESFEKYVQSQVASSWRNAMKIDGLDLKPVLANTRIWVCGNPTNQSSYSDEGEIIDISDGTLPEPEEQYINFSHLVSPPPDDPDENVELAELMKMPLDKRVEHLAQVAKEVRHLNEFERGKQSH